MYSKQKSVLSIFNNSLQRSFLLEIFPTGVMSFLREILSLWEKSPSSHCVPLHRPAFFLAHHKKRETILSVFCERGGNISWEKGVIMLSDGAKKRKRKKRKKRTKASHCSSSPTLEVVVQVLASLGLGWGCPALGPVWKQIFQVSAIQWWRRISSGCPLCVWIRRGLPQTAWDFFPIWVLSSRHKGFQVHFRLSQVVFEGSLRRKLSYSCYTSVYDLCFSLMTTHLWSARFQEVKSRSRKILDTDHLCFTQRRGNRRGPVWDFVWRLLR